MIANIPMRTGMIDTPAISGVSPKVKRGVPVTMSMPIIEIRRPAQIESPPLTAEPRLTAVAQESPSRASQKYS